MNQEIILIALAGGLMILFCYTVYQWVLVPRKSGVKAKSAKRAKSTKQNISNAADRKNLQIKLAIANMFKNFPLVKLTEEEKEYTRSLILAVDKRNDQDRLLMPEEIYCTQLALAGGVFLICLAAMLLTPLSLVGLAVIPFVMSIPIKKLESEREEAQAALGNEFLAFYRLYYVVFSKKENTSTISNVINSYLPNASLQVKKILKAFDSDLARGDEFALKRFDERFPTSTKVHKFCAVARARLKGDETCYEPLDTFLKLLIEEQDLYYDREMNKRYERLNKSISTFLMISLAVVCLMSFGTMLL